MKRLLAILLAGLMFATPFSASALAQAPKPSASKVTEAASDARPEAPASRRNRRRGTPVLRLIHGAVDPAALPEEVPDPKGEARLYVVQFHDVITEASHAVLKRAGVEDGPYLPDNALVVRMTPAQFQQVRQDKLVRAVTPFRAEWKLSPAFREAAAEVDVQVLTLPGGSDPGAAQVQAFSQLGAKAAEAIENGYMLRGLPTRTALSLAEREDVLFVDLVTPATYLNDVARGIMRVNGQANNPWSLGLKGNGQTIAVADSGLDTGNANTLHPDLKSRFKRAYIWNNRNSWSDIHGHGTHVAGSVLGTGAASDGQFAGVAPNAQLIFQSLHNSDGSLGVPADVKKLFEQAKTAGAKIHSNSWGAPVPGWYDSRSQAVDQFTWTNKDFSILFAAGNSGPDYWTINSPGTAKNAITIGASESYRPEMGTLADDPNEPAWFTSVGPTADNRMKPDLVAPGTWILSTRSSLAGDVFWDLHENPAYAYMGGSSMSTPLAAGATAIVREGLQKKGFSNPSAALIKATLINGAQEMGGGWMNPAYGWGRIDLTQSLSPGNGRAVQYKDITNGLKVGGTHTYTYSMKAGEILKFTLVWTDQPGSPAAEYHLVNDLDLLVTGPGNVQYVGNCFTDTWETSATGCEWPDQGDGVNNVENVYLAAPVEGTYTVKVFGYDVPKGPQPYALVVSGIVKETTKPTVKIIAPAANATLSGLATITAEATDNAGIDYVEFYNGDTLLTTVDTPDPESPLGRYSAGWDTQFVPQDGTRTLHVKAYDFNQNVGTASVSVVVDNQSPTVGITSPPNGGLVRGLVTVTSAAADSTGVTKVEFELDGSVRFTDTSSPFTWAWDSTKSPDGQYELASIAYDKVNNTAESAISVTVDNTLPSLSLSPANGASLAGSMIPLTATADDLNGVTKVEFSVTNSSGKTTKISTDTNGTDGWTASWNSASVSPGTYKLVAVATDRAGNTRTVTHSVTVDSAKPGLNITSPTANAKLTGTVTVKGTATDNKQVVSVAIHVDDALQTTLTPTKATTSYPFQWTWATSGDGPRTLKFVITDAAGNKTERLLSVFVDHTNPTVSITAPSQGDWAGASTTITANAADNVAVAKVEFLVNGAKVGEDTSAPYAYTWNTSKLSTTAYTLTARVVDGVGRTATSAPVVVNVDNVAPKSLVIGMSPSPGTTPFRGSTTVTATVAPEDNVAKVLFYVDSALVQTDTEAPFAFDFDTTTVADGSRKVTADAYDPAGNKKSVTATVNVDNSAPTYTLTGLAANQQIAAAVKVTLAAKDSTSLKHLRVWIDDDEAHPLFNQALSGKSSSKSITVAVAALDDGDHTLRIQVTDAAGNVQNGSLPFRLDQTAPTVSLESPAKVGLGSVTLQATPADDSGISKVVFYAGSSVIGTDTNGGDGWTATWNVTSRTSSGSQSLKAVAFDLAGNSASASRPVSVDSGLPTVSIAKPTANAVVKGSSVALEAKATDAKGIAKVEVYVDDELFDSATPEGQPTSFTYNGTWDSTEGSSGAHTIKVKATDSHGNVTIKSAAVKVDNALPVVSITAPSDEGYVAASSTVRASLTDAGAGIKKIEVLVNGTVKNTSTLRTPAASQNFTWTWSTKGLPAGQDIVLAIRVTDVAGNVTTDSVTVQVDTAAPSATLTSPTAGLVRGTVSVDIEATDNVGLARAEILLGTTKIATLEGDGSGSQSFQYDWNTSGKSGSQTLNVKVYDLAGNSTTKSVRVTVDNTAPTIKIDAPKNNATVKGTVTVRATATDSSGITKVEFYLDGELMAADSTSSYTWSWKSTDVEDGTYTITAKTFDKAGHEKSATITVTVDNTP